MASNSGVSMKTHPGTLEDLLGAKKPKKNPAYIPKSKKELNKWFKLLDQALKKFSLPETRTKIGQREDKLRKVPSSEFMLMDIMEFQKKNYGLHQMVLILIGLIKKSRENQID